MTEITALRGRVTREEALAAFQPGGLVGGLQLLVSGPLRSIAEAYVPFRLFRATVQNGRGAQDKFLAIDAVDGSLDLYGFDAEPVAGELMRVETRNAVPCELPVERCAELIEDRLRRMIYRRGFFRARGLQNRIRYSGNDFYVPYWLGFRGRGERAQLAVMDAVRRRFEGGKARELFRQWLVGGVDGAGSTRLAATE
jgi:hypothetical protein